MSSPASWKTTDPTITSNTCTPGGRRVYDAEVILHAIRAGSWFRDEMGGRGLTPLDLHKAFGAYRLVATSGVVDVRRVVLEHT